MSKTRQSAPINGLRSIYEAIKNDDVAALESALKANPIDINQSISVYDDTYEPVNQCASFNLLNENRAVTAKKPAEIAFAMGHVYCTHWLLDHGADVKPLIMYSATLAQLDSSKSGNLHLHSYACRFIDDKTNYMKSASLAMAYLDKLTPEELNMLGGMVGDSGEEVNSANRPG
jgi:hypothetical protein